MPSKAHYNHTRILLNLGTKTGCKAMPHTLTPDTQEKEQTYRHDNNIARCTVGFHEKLLVVKPG